MSSQSVFWRACRPRLREATRGRHHLAHTGQRETPNDGGYWLLDEIAIIQPYNKTVAAEEFQVWKLAVHPDRTATLIYRNAGGASARSLPTSSLPTWSIRIVPPSHSAGCACGTTSSRTAMNICELNGWPPYLRSPPRIVCQWKIPAISALKSCLRPRGARLVNACAKCKRMWGSSSIHTDRQYCAVDSITASPLLAPATMSKGGATRSAS